MGAVRASFPWWIAIATCFACGSNAPPPNRSPHPALPDAPLPPLPWLEEEAARPRPGPVESPAVALRGGTVLTATGRTIPNGVVLMEDGRIVAVGSADEVEIPEGAQVVDTTGRFVTPGLIDTHSHMGVYAQPEIHATDDGNEATAPVTAEVRAADSFWPQDPALARAVAGGITTIQVLPGSANLIGGRGVIFKLHLGRSADEMRFPGAPDTVKMACGENPKRVYGGRDAAPSTRMGNVAGYRRSFQQAVEYGRTWQTWRETHRIWHIKTHKYREWRRGYERTRMDQDAGTEVEDPGPAPAPPARDFGLETLLGAIDRRVLVQMHCYRADEMLLMVRMSHEFGFRVRSFHHAVEAYKIRDVLAEENIGVSTWADWWGFKLEAFDAIPENLALLAESGVPAAMHSDSAMLIQRLNQEAAKAMASGRASGIEVSEDTALRWITAQPAWILGVEEQTGTLEPGKMADVVVWSGTPWSVYTRADLVYIDGLLVHDRATRPLDRTDFELGLGVSE